MKVSHNFAASSAVFDDDHLVSCAGLVPVMALAAQTGLSDLVAGKVAESPRAQAEVYALQGAWSPAIGQLEIALREGKADFYTQSVMDARLREFRARYDDERAWRERR